MCKKNITIAIDGNSGCGKSTLAKDLAKKLGYTHIDSGAMYRAITLFILEQKIKIPPKSFDFLEKISIKQNLQGETFLNNKIVNTKIQSIEVSKWVSEVSKFIKVRNFINTILHQMSKTKGIIVDGRDIGTYVLPNAELKLFITADIEKRAQRRYQELKLKDPNIQLQNVQKNLITRDTIDSQRKNHPLKKADDAIIIDTSKHTQLSQLNHVLQILLNKKLIPCLP